MKAPGGSEQPIQGKSVNRIRILFTPFNLLVLLAFLTGFVLRVWDFGNLPSGLHVDEASIGVEAASLHDYGIDRNGESFPVHFISWGSGQNVLYAYLLAPLVPFGLSPFVLRLPMLISGLLTLPIVYAIARKLFSPSVALLSIFLLAVSPWHIMLSRWAIESNLLPFVFSLAFLCLLKLDRNPIWFLASMVLLALSLYAYGTAYFLVPLFIVLVAGFLLLKPVVSRKIIFIGIALFTLLSIPILLFVLINYFQWDEIHLGLITIPRLTGAPRFIEMTALRNGSGISYFLSNILTTTKILFLQWDIFLYNSIPPYGFLFPGAIVLAILGAFLVWEKIKNQKTIGLWAFGAWLLLSLLLCVIQNPMVQRLNILFIPLILCVAVAFDWIIRDKKFLAAVVTLGVSAYCVLFWREYTGSEFRNNVGWSFNDGLIPAIQSVQPYPNQPVCITNEMDMPYIYVELVEQKNPKIYLAGIQYVDPDAQFRIVEKLERYSFGIQNCALDANQIYILKSDQKFPLDESLFTSRTFDDYVVYIPQKIG